MTVVQPACFALSRICAFCSAFMLSCKRMRFLSLKMVAADWWPGMFNLPGVVSIVVIFPEGSVMIWEMSVGRSVFKIADVMMPSRRNAVRIFSANRSFPIVAIIDILAPDLAAAMVWIAPEPPIWTFVFSGVI